MHKKLNQYQFLKAALAIVLFTAYAPDQSDSIKTKQNGSFFDRKTWLFDHAGAGPSQGCAMAEKSVYRIAHEVHQRCDKAKIFGNSQIEVLEGGQLTLDGDLQLYGNALIHVHAGGKLIINGDLKVAGNANFLVDGSFTCAGFIDISGHGMACGNGTAEVFGSISGTGWCMSLETKPMQLFSVKAELQNDHDVVLTWSSESQAIGQHFVIERSENGMSFTEIGQLEEEGTKKLTSYQFLDSQVSEGNHYYRIRRANSQDDQSPFEITHVSIVKSRERCMAEESLNCSPYCDINVADCESGTYDLQVLNIRGDYMTESIDLKSMSRHAMDYHLDKENFLIPGVYTVSKSLVKSNNDKKEIVK